MTDIPIDCICRRLLDLGIVEAVENAAQRDDIFIAMQACLDKGACQQRGTATADRVPAPPPANEPEFAASRRKRSDRRRGTERRQTDASWPMDRERRTGSERRSGGDRRGLLAGETYTPQQAVLNLRAWCNGHCRGTFDLQLDSETGELRFHFDDPDDRAGFTAMLRKFKGLAAQRP